MIRRTLIIAVTALGLSAGAVHGTPVLNRFVSSAQSFRYYYQDLQKSGTSMSAIERFVFSLMLANPKTPEVQACLHEHRT